MAPAPGIRVPCCGSDQATTSQGSHPTWKLAQSVLIWPRTYSRSMPSIVPAKLLSARRCDARRCDRFFEQLEPCLVGIEACGTSHYWAREISKCGHDVRLMPPAYVKPYVKRGKSDASDAEAICEAVTRPTMRYVAIKSPEQQAILALHRTRDLFVKQRTQLVNMIRSLLAEFGIEIRRGIEQALMVARRITEEELADIPPLAAKVIAACRSRSSTYSPSCASSNASCSSGIARAMWPSGLRPSRGLARSAPQHLRRRSQTRSSSDLAGSSPPGWA